MFKQRGEFKFSDTQPRPLPIVRHDSTSTESAEIYVIPTLGPEDDDCDNACIAAVRMPSSSATVPLAMVPPAPKVPPPLPGEEYDFVPGADTSGRSSEISSPGYRRRSPNLPDDVPPAPPSPKNDVAPPSYNDVRSGRFDSIAQDTVRVPGAGAGGLSKSRSQSSIQLPNIDTSTSRRTVSDLTAVTRSASATIKKESKYIEKRVHVAPFSKFYLFFSNLIGVVSSECYCAL